MMKACRISGLFKSLLAKSEIRQGSGYLFVRSAHQLVQLLKTHGRVPLYRAMGSFPFGSGARSPGIRVTAWRLLNSVVLLVFGVTKAVYAYLGYVTTPTTLEWLLGVGWALMYGFPLLAPDVPPIE